MLDPKDIQIMANIALVLASLVVIIFYLLPALFDQDISADDFIRSSTLGELEIGQVAYFEGNPTALFRKRSCETYVYLEDLARIHAIQPWAKCTQVTIEEVMSNV